MSALSAFTSTWDDDILASDLAERLTCRELDALCDVFEASGDADTAKMWRDFHAEGDDEGDSHYIAKPDEHGPVAATWFGKGKWPTCECGVAPKDNAVLKEHWEANGFEVVDEQGTLVKRPI